MDTLKDLLTIDTDKNKAEDNKKLLRKLKQMIKSDKKEEEKKELDAETLPYEAVSVVGNKFVTLKFDLESKEAMVVNTEVDVRDTGHKNYMAGTAASNAIRYLVRNQKE